MTAQVAIAVAVGLAAITDDLLRRQVSNWIPALAFVGGVAALTVERGWRGTGSALMGTVGGFVVFLVFYLLGGMGGGDVKLMAGFGAVLGWERLLEATLWTAACGGLIALATIALAALRRRSVIAIPYAPAISLGAWLALIPKI